MDNKSPRLTRTTPLNRIGDKGLAEWRANNVMGRFIDQSFAACVRPDELSAPPPSAEHKPS